MISCKIHDEGISDAVEFYATSQELHELNGLLKAKKNLDHFFRVRPVLRTPELAPELRIFQPHDSGRFCSSDGISRSCFGDSRSNSERYLNACWQT